MAALFYSLFSNICSSFLYIHDSYKSVPAPVFKKLYNDIQILNFYFDCSLNNTRMVDTLMVY